MKICNLLALYPLFSTRVGPNALAQQHASKMLLVDHYMSKSALGEGLLMRAASGVYLAAYC